MSTWHGKRSVLATLLLIVCLLLALIYLSPAGKNILKLSPGHKEQPVLPAVIPAGAEALSQKQSLPMEISVPEGAGHIVEGYKSTGKDTKVIIHIQDIHTNYEAQKNLSRIIEALIKEKGLKLVMVEGGWGDVGLSHLRYNNNGVLIPKERRQSVADEYLKAGKISGEEYLDISSEYEIDLEGLEDEDLYMANLEAFFDIEQFREKAAPELDSIKLVVERLKEKIYPAQLLDLEREKNDYEEEKISLADYYRQINTLAKKTGQDISAFPNFQNFIGVTELEKDINFPLVEKERTRLIETLSKKLSKQRLANLVTRSLEFRLNKLTPAEYHSFLMGEADESGESLDSYPNLTKYVDYINSHEDIDTARLFTEADEITEKIKDRLIDNPRQRRLNEISTSLRVLDNFLNLKLVPDDFKYYKEHKEDFITANWIDFLDKEIRRNRLNILPPRPAYTVDKNLSTLVRFYDIANQRDDVFVRNAIALMNEKEQNLAVLIAGGFHTPPLKQKLRECGISYIVVAPYTTQATDPELYRYILKYKSGKEE
jgi:hypothetical protein